MIDDPIKLNEDGPNSWNRLLPKFVGSTQFAISSTGRCLYYCDVLKSRCEANCYKYHFAIYRNSTLNSFVIRNDDGSIADFGVTKDQFIDALSDRYPDHFEWLLFHPEWL